MTTVHHAPEQAATGLWAAVDLDALPPIPSAPHRRGRILQPVVVTLVVVIVLALGVTVGRSAAAWFGGRNALAPATSPASGASNGVVPGAGGNALTAPGTGTGGTASGMPGGLSPSTVPDVAAITSAVDPAVVDVDSQLGLDNSTVSGTGMVLSGDGVVLTNNHVVNGATSISVTDIGDGKVYAASVVGTDPSADVAVLRLSGASGLPTVRIGGSAGLAAGQAVLAIGNAWGAGGTPSTSQGSIVALNQSIAATDQASHGTEHLEGLIETDAALRPGDSGGPLVNAAGAVIGMDSAASGSFQIQGSAGNGFAIPIDRAMAIARQILGGQASSTVHVGTGAFLGVSVQAPTGVAPTTTPGAVVVVVVPGSPADGIGLLSGDEIISLGGRQVDSTTTLQGLLRAHQVGDIVSVTWLDALGLEHSGSVQLSAGPAD